MKKADAVEKKVPTLPASWSAGPESQGSAAHQPEEQAVWPDGEAPQALDEPWQEETWESDAYEMGAHEEWGEHPYGEWGNQAYVEACEDGSVDAWPAWEGDFGHQACQESWQWPSETYENAEGYYAPEASTKKIIAHGVVPVNITIEHGPCWTGLLRRHEGC